MARFSYPDCVLDDGFNADGYWNEDLPGGIEALTAIAVHPTNGRIAVGGYQQDLFSSEYDMVVAVISDSGSLDSGFSENGWLTLDFADAGYDDFVARVAFDNAGGLFAAGTTDYTGDGADADWAIAKFDSSGALDPTFGFGGVSLIPFDAGPDDHDDDYGWAMAMQAGRVVVAGGVEVNAAGDYRVGLARLDVALMFADSFESGAVNLWSSSTGAP